MQYVSEQVVKDLISQDAITEAVEACFRSLALGNAFTFPIVRESLNHADAVFGFKSGFDKSSMSLGVKAGGLWPGNAARGEPNHQSTIILFDEDSGAPSALVRATHLTSLRTASASALSIRCLARRESRVLGVVGAGGQSLFQVDAALKERAFERIIIADKSEFAAAKLAKLLTQRGLSAAVATVEKLAAQADVIITVTPSRSPILTDGMIKPGTHLACMGADTVGKQEVTVELAKKASLFCDVPEQSITLGECQHAFNAGLISKKDITSIGEVLTAKRPGRTGQDEITLFDSTGMALQDLAAAACALEIAQNENVQLNLP